MIHHAERVMAAMTQIITGLLTTESRVYRGRVTPLAEDEIPALSIYQGQDDPVEGRNLTDSSLTVNITAHIKQDDANIDTELNKIRREVHVALMADIKLGLSFVIQIIPQGADEPRISADSEMTTASLETTWEVHYRHLSTDPGESL